VYSVGRLPSPTDSFFADTLETAYGSRPPALPGTLGGSAQKCQKTLAKAANGLATGWTRALSACEDANARGANVPPADCSTDPDGSIARARAKAASRVETCDSLSGIPGCATTGSPAATTTCIESAIEPMAPRYTGVAYP